MRKTYEKPELNIEQFDVEDVITVSEGGNKFLQTVGGVMEQMVDMFNSLGS